MVEKPPPTACLPQIGSFIAPVFAPLGFGDWRAATALITGITAKEVVISTLSVLTGSGDELTGSALQKPFLPAYGAQLFNLCPALPTLRGSACSNKA